MTVQNVNLIFFYFERVFYTLILTAILLTYFIELSQKFIRKLKVFIHINYNCESKIIIKLKFSSTIKNKTEINKNFLIVKLMDLMNSFIYWILN